MDVIIWTGRRAEPYTKGFCGNDLVPAELKLTDLARGTGIWLISFK
jgi:hypothetical protein